MRKSSPRGGGSGGFDGGTGAGELFLSTCGKACKRGGNVKLSVVGEVFVARRFDFDNL